MPTRAAAPPAASNLRKMLTGGWPLKLLVVATLRLALAAEESVEDAADEVDKDNPEE